MSGDDGARIVRTLVCEQCHSGWEVSTIGVYEDPDDDCPRCHRPAVERGRYCSIPLTRSP